MKKIFFGLCMIVFLQPRTANSWGFYGHRTINYAAVFTLPQEIFPFYKQHLEILREQAVNPDKRRYIIDDEAPRHYLDADFYEKEVPLDSIPHLYDSAISLYGEQTVLSHGIVPWHVIRVKHWLTKAFKEKDVGKIVRLSADIGHYIGDLHVPLHSTHNYNGQLTNQHGIHGFWESRLPELFGEEYDLFTGEAEYIENVSQLVWERFEQSFAAKDSVLFIEKILNQNTKQDKKYSFEQRGNQTVRTYSFQYSDLYHKRLNNMVERRLRQSISMVGCIWFTAWVDAGQPDLSNFEISKVLESKEDSVNTTLQPIKGRFEPH